ncbi:hypothetical protein BDD12DRAFT_807465 [Trichophaea hybrida]|nr:hypothetical protein BDD12DRAFT_807465 [Trichophaea hybrida]
MSGTSSLKLVSEMLQQPMPEATKRYLDKLAAEINVRGQGLTDDDLWTAQGRLKGVPRETLRWWLEVRMHSDPPVQASPGSFSSPPNQGQKRPHTNTLHLLLSLPAASPKPNRRRPRANPIVTQKSLHSPPDSSASPQIGEMGPPGLPSEARDISIEVTSSEEARNPSLDAEFLDLAYTMQNMGQETVSDMMSKLYAAMAKSYPKHKGEPLEKFCPDPEKTLAQQLVVWKYERDDLLEDRKERKKKAKENPNITNLKRERANHQSSLGPYWSQ